MRLRTVAAILVCAFALAGDEPPSAQSRGSKTWIGRYHEFEDYLRTADCVSMNWLAPNYAAKCHFRPGGPIAAMAWRPLIPRPPGVRRGFRENYQAEIVAYELDKLLAMNMVPPTVERQLQGTDGSAQQWVEDVVDATGPTLPEGKERERWDHDVLRMTMFDSLIGNRGRVPTNMLRDSTWNLILIDHSRGFGTDVGRVGRLKAVDRELWTKIDALTLPQLDGALGRWLAPAEIKAILDRRDLMRADVKSLAKMSEGRRVRPGQ
jgi:hypothetical protein